MRLPVQIVYGVSTPQTVEYEAIHYGQPVTVSSATATIYDYNGTSVATPTVTINGNILSISYDFSGFDKSLDNMVEFVYTGDLNGETIVHRARVFFDVVEYPLEADIDYDMLAELEPAIQFTAPINSTDEVEPFVHQAFIAGYARLRVMGILPHYTVDRYLWQQILIHETLWRIFSSVNDLDRVRYHQDSAQNLWAQLKANMRIGDVGGVNSGTIQGRLIR